MFVGTWQSPKKAVPECNETSPAWRNATPETTPAWIRRAARIVQIRAADTNYAANGDVGGERSGGCATGARPETVRTSTLILEAASFAGVEAMRAWALGRNARTQWHTRQCSG